MREIATLADPTEAQVLVDYLLTQEIDAMVRMEGKVAEIWIRNEDDVPLAKLHYEEFTANPKDAKYRAATRPAKELRRLQDEVKRNYAALYKDADDFWGRPHPSKVPITITLIVLSIVATIYTEFGNNQDHFYQLAITSQPAVVKPANMEGLSIVELRDQVRAEQWKAIKQGEYWRIITPIFLHLNPLHLLFNTYALYSLCGVIECRRRRYWVIGFILGAAAFSNLIQFILPDVFSFNLAERIRQGDVTLGTIGFGGMSGVCFALFGYLAGKAVYAPEPGLSIPSDSIYFMMFWLVICMTGAVGSIANTAHVAGLVFGLVLAVAPKMFQRYRLRQ
jgi:GlpG protein